PCPARRVGSAASPEPPSLALHDALPISWIVAGAPGSVAAVRHSTVILPFIGGTKAVVRSIVYVYVQSAVIVGSHAVYRYVHTRVPSHVSGSGVSTKPTSTGTTSRPHASWIVAGAPGSVAAVRHSTVIPPFIGGTKAVVRSIVYVYVQSAVIVGSHAVYRYVHTRVPSHVSGSGVSTKPASTRTTWQPRASWIVAGAPGSVAAVR